MMSRSPAILPVREEIASLIDPKQLISDISKQITDLEPRQEGKNFFSSEGDVISRINSVSRLYLSTRKALLVRTKATLR